MTKSFDVQVELEHAVDFGFAMVTAHGEFPPSCSAYNGDLRLFVGCRPFAPDKDEQDEKDGSFSMMASAVRAWGATNLIVVADSHMRRLEQGQSLEVMPSQDPLSTDAMVAYHFARSGQGAMLMVGYHRDDAGNVVQDDRDLDEAPPPGEILGSGRVPELFGAAMTMTDHQVHRMLRTAPTPIQTPTELLSIMAMMGFSVFETTPENTRVYVTGDDEYEQMKQMLIRDGWEERR